MNFFLAKSKTAHFHHYSNVTENDYGYIYCMSNPGMRENTYKLGFTQNDPINRARQLYTESVVEPFVIEFAKKVLLQKEKFQMITNILDEHGCRISKDRTFYCCEIDEIRNLFSYIKGVWYIPDDKDTDGKYRNIADEHEDTEEDNKMIIVDENDETHSYPNTSKLDWFASLNYATL